MSGAEALDEVVGGLIRWDRRALLRVAGPPPRHLAAMRAVTGLGSRPVAYAVLGAQAVVLARGGRAADGVRALATLAAGDLAREALCRRIGRARPPAWLCRTSTTGPSFPSRHATTAAITAAALVRAAPDRDRGPVSVAVAAAALGVGVSRVRLGAHWPSDVLAGWLFGAGWWALCRGRAAGTQR